MENCTKCKSNGLSDVFIHFIFNDCLEINMLIKPIMNWLIPFSIEFLKSGGIPPVLIKLPIIKFGDLSKEIGQTLKSKYKHNNNQECRG